MPAILPSFTIYPLCEHAVTLQFSEVISEVVLQQINRYHQLINTKPFSGFKESVPAYTTLSIFYNPLQVMQAADLPGKGCFEKVSDYIGALQNEPLVDRQEEVNTVTIPVFYGGDFGPDLEYVAEHNQLSIEEVIKLHSQAIYKVYMMGFVPGFAYLGGMDEQLATPRKAVPRKATPAGSVGIAGKQTGIYPLETPGGWQLIGHTPLKLFDAYQLQPALLKAGDQVVFKRISMEEYYLISETIDGKAS